MLGLVVLDCIVRWSRSRWVAYAEDEAVGVGLVQQELFDDFETESSGGT